MKTFKQLMALLLVFVLVAACVPLGTIAAFAAENDETDISAVDTEIDAEPAESTEPAETGNEVAPLPNESSGTEPEEEHTPTEALEEDSLPSEPEEEVPESIPDEEETEPDPENPFLDLANEFDPEVLDFLWELFPDGEIPMDFDLVDFFNSYTTYGGSSGSETGDGGGGGNAAGSGSSNMVAAGVTMQIVYYRYDQCYNRYNSHGSVVGTLQNGKALPWNSTGKGLDAFRSEMIADTRIRELHDYLNASDCFGNGVEIKGGVCYFLWDRVDNTKPICYNIAKKNSHVVLISVSEVFIWQTAKTETSLLTALWAL